MRERGALVKRLHLEGSVWADSFELAFMKGEVGGS